MVEGARLESVYTPEKRIKGSNPSLSASYNFLPLPAFIDRQSAGDTELNNLCTAVIKNSLLIALVLVGTNAVWAQADDNGANGEVIVDGALSPSGPSPAGKSHQLKRDYAQIALNIRLPAVALAQKAAAQADKGQPLEIGFGRTLPLYYQGNLASRLAWDKQNDGSVVSALSLSSPGSRALRLALRAKLPAGATLRFFNPADAKQRFPPLRRQDFSVDFLWSPVIEGDTVGLEISLSSAAAVANLSLTVARVSHLTESLAKRLTDIGDSASCQIDVACRTTTPSNLPSAVAKMLYTEADGRTFLCTGTLMNDTVAGSFVPYFLTAYHCINTQAVARTLETYWNFERASCGGAAPTSVPPPTRGADLLATHSLTDSTLLRLSNSPPAGSFYAGWRSGTLSHPAEVIGIHHPAGDLKKWSGGTTLYHERATVGGRLTDGIRILEGLGQGFTEGGSSGSGLFDIDGRLRGVLSGGPFSSCRQSNRGIYGRFDQFYPQARRWLNPTDAEPAAVNVIPTSLSLTEEGTAGTYQISLSAQPTSNVTVTITSNNAEISPIPTALTFTANDWHTEQTVTVSAGSDPGDTDDTATLSHTVSGYGSVTVPAVMVTVADDEAAGICSRTRQVREAIVAATEGIDNCANITAEHLRAITTLNLDDKNIRTLQTGDFAGLTALVLLIVRENQLSTLPAGVFNGLAALEQISLAENQLSTLPAGLFNGLAALELLILRDNQLSALPADVFAGLTMLDSLNLSSNQLSVLPANVFAGLTALAELYLYNNQLNAFPANVFSGLTALEQLYIYNNQFNTLPANVFSGLSSLNILWLQGNQLSSLPSDLFSNLTALTSLSLGRNRLSTLPAGLFADLTALQELYLYTNRFSTLATNVFTGLTQLDTLWLYGNPVEPMPVNISLIPTGLGQVKAKVLTGAPFDMILPITTSNGTFAGGDTVSSTIITTGNTESAPFAIIRAPDATGPTTVAIGTLPALPPSEFDSGSRKHQGYRPVKSGLPLRLFVPGVTITPTNLRMTEGTTNDYTVALNHAPTGQVTVTVSSNNTEVSTMPTALTFAPGNWYMLQTVTIRVAADSDKLNDTAILSHSVSGYDPVTNAPTVMVTVTDDSLTGGICDRTQQVREAIVAETAEATSCAEVTANHLRMITTLALNEQNLSTLQAGDFAGLTGLTSLFLYDNQLSVLPPGIFTGLTALATIDLDDNQLNTLPAGLFTGLTALESLWLQGNPSEPAFTVSLSRVGTGQAKATIDTGAAFALTLPITATNGTFADGSTTGNITIATGHIESSAFTVTRTPGAIGETRVDIGTLPSLPISTFTGNTPKHRGYGLAKSLQLPLRLFQPGVNIAPTSLTLHEGTSGIYRVALNTAPTGQVTVTVTSNNNDAASPAPAALTFTTGDWQTAQTVTVTAKSDSDDVDDLATLSHGVSGYGSVTAPGVMVTVADDEAVTAGVSLSVSNLRLTEATTSPYTVVLNKLPTGNVTITMASDNPDISPSPTALTFTTGDWYLPQTITVTAGADDDIIHDTATLTHAVSGYGSVTAPPLTITVADDDAGICARTQQVYAAIVAATAGISNCADVTADHLGRITLLDLPRRQNITALQAGDFAGLTALETLSLDNNQLSTLPPEVFTGLTALETLSLHSNRLSTLPPEVFTGLTALETLSLHSNRLSTWPPELFAGLTALAELYLGVNDFRSLPAGLFSGLTALEVLTLSDAQLRSLPAGIFAGLTALDALWLHDNLTEPISIPISLVRVGTQHFKVKVPTGAPFPLSLPINATHGTVTVGGTAVSSIRMAVGSTESAPFMVTRTGGPQDATTVDLGALPPLPTDRRVFGFLNLPKYRGYQLVKSSLPLLLFGPGVQVEPTRLTIAEGSTGTYTVVPNDTPTDNVTITVTSDNSEVSANPAALTFTNSNWSTARTVTVNTGTDDDIFHDTAVLSHVVSGYGSVTAPAVMVTVTDDDAGICDRTQQVHAAIVAATAGINDCANITADHLEAITMLHRSFRSISTLQIGDFSGLTALTNLGLSINQLSSLPVGVFAGLTALEELNLSSNRLSSLPIGVFTGLTALERLYLDDNQLSTLPAGLFAGLTALETLSLYGNQLSSLPAGVFAGLTALERLTLYENELSSLPAGVFAGLTALERLWLDDNQLSALPAGVFAGLQALDSLWLQSNPGTPLPLTVSLDRVSTGQVKATIDTGAPFPLSLPINATNGTTTDADGNPISSIAIATGSIESPIFTVTRPAMGEARVDIGTLPPLPTELIISGGDPKHQGYTLVKSSQLPLRLFQPGVNIIPTDLIVTEGSSGNYTVNLNTAPTGPVTVSITTADSTKISTAPEALSFTMSDWNTNQTVTVRAQPDPDEQDESITLSHFVTGYGTVATAAQVNVTITDTTVNHPANLNNDDALDGDDALLLYYVDLLGSRAEASGLLGSLTGGLSVAQAVSNATAWQEEVSTGDLNDDNRVDWQDALAMYYAYTFAHLLGDGRSGGHRRLRATLLSGLVGRLPNDEGGYKELLRRANRLRSEVHTP